MATSIQSIMSMYKDLVLGCVIGVLGRNVWIRSTLIVLGRCLLLSFFILSLCINVYTKED